jgi:hypothetical protein
VNSQEYFDTSRYEEVEVIRIDDLEVYLKEMGVATSDDQVKNLKMALAPKNLLSKERTQMVKMEDLLNLMETLGIKESKPRSKRHLKFE